MSQQNRKEWRNSSVTKSTHCSLEDPSSNSSTQISADHSKLSCQGNQHPLPASMSIVSACATDIHASKHTKYILRTIQT